MGAPERQCIGCGRRGPQSALLRLAVARDEDGLARVVIADSRTNHGRGAYLCRKLSCLERAAHRKAFQRAFRTTVVVERDELVAELIAVRGTEPQADGG